MLKQLKNQFREIWAIKAEWETIREKLKEIKRPKKEDKQKK